MFDGVDHWLRLDRLVDGDGGSNDFGDPLLCYIIKFFKVPGRWNQLAKVATCRFQIGLLTEAKGHAFIVAEEHQNRAAGMQRVTGHAIPDSGFQLRSCFGDYVVHALHDRSLGFIHAGNFAQHFLEIFIVFGGHEHILSKMPIFISVARLMRWLAQHPTWTCPENFSPLHSDSGYGTWKRCRWRVKLPHLHNTNAAKLLP